MAREKGKLRGAIVAMTRDQVIGVDGKLPWHYSEDLKRFKRRTMGCAVIMGRVTWDSIGRKALPGRRNIVLSRSKVAGVECYDSIEKTIAACGDQDLWVMGGAQIYKAAMAHLNLLDITYVPDEIDRDDAVRFPKIDLSCWKGGKEKKFSSHDRLTYSIYHRINSG